LLLGAGGGKSRNRGSLRSLIKKGGVDYDWAGVEGEKNPLEEVLNMSNEIGRPSKFERTVRCGWWKEGGIGRIKIQGRVHSSDRVEKEGNGVQAFKWATPEP